MHDIFQPRAGERERLRHALSDDEFGLKLDRLAAPLRALRHQGCLGDAIAARLVAERGDPTEAAVASVEVAKSLPLIVLAERIQTYPDNFTRFVAIGTRDAGLGRATKTSLVLAVKHTPGALLATLGDFAEHGVNLAKLESRPRRGAPFEYLFHVDLDGSVDDDEVRAAIEAARAHTSLLRVLGSYPAAT